MPYTDQKLTIDHLTHYFHEGVKKPSEVAVGIEWEKIGVQKTSGLAIPYSGSSGVEAILLALVQQNGWVPELQNNHPIALSKQGASITLEPGGQIELSGQIFKNLSDNEKEITSHLAEIRRVSEPLGIAWLGIGAQPISRAPEIEWVPKKRYAVMRELLGRQGNLTYSMMKETASIQVSLDYTSEQDAMEKLALAFRLTPYLTALLPNSPFEGGKRSHFLSRRSYIWSKTAPERTGFVQQVLQDRADFKSYVDYALDVPMLFIRREGDWQMVRNRTFRQFMDLGYEGLEASLADWELHLTGIFTEARLKHYVEIRSIDCQQTSVGLAAAALLKGLFYHDASRRKALSLIGRATAAQIAEATASARENGLRAVLQGKLAHETAAQLVQIAKEGLTALGKNEQGYLKTLEDIIATGRTPAETLLSCIQCNSSDTLRPVIDCAQI